MNIIFGLNIFCIKSQVRDRDWPDYCCDWLVFIMFTVQNVVILYCLCLDESEDVTSPHPTLVPGAVIMTFSSLTVNTPAFNYRFYWRLSGFICQLISILLLLLPTRLPHNTGDKLLTI